MDSTLALYKAMSKAQALMSHATKDSTNPAFKSKYADLSAVINATLPHLNANGLSLIQLPTFEQNADGSVDHVLITRIMHDDGGVIECKTPIVVRDQTNPQSFGSGITYARRYALSALCCIAQEDDDGEHAKQGAPTKPEPKKSPTKREMFEDAVLKLGKRERMLELLGEFGVESLSEIKDTDFNAFFLELKK